MFKERLVAYKKMGYKIETQPDGKAERLAFAKVKKIRLIWFATFLGLPLGSLSGFRP
jgi:hypothetical protein